VKEKKIIIIGAGIAGLTAACYAQKNGYDVELFEMHSKCGGVCTGWNRKGYYFDGCLHFLVGTGKDKVLHNMWNELGLFEENGTIQHNEICTMIHEDNKKFVVPAQIDKFEQYLINHFASDSTMIEEFCEAVGTFSTMQLPEKPRELMKLKDLFKLIKMMKPYFPYFKKYGKISVGEYVKRFKSRELAQYILNIFGVKEFPLLALIFSLSYFNNGNAGWPCGGSEKLAKSLEKQCISLGAKINYNCRVKKILLKKKRAEGIELENGIQAHADRIISAADGYSTIYNMLGGKFINKRINNRYKQAKLWQPLMMISLGLKSEHKTITHADIHLLDRSIKIGSLNVDGLWVKNYAFDASLQTGSKSFISVLFPTSFSYWEKLSKKRNAYDEEKKRIKKDIVDYLETRYPGIKAKTEVVDIATPMTTYKYTGNRQGSFEGWLFTPKNFGKQYERTLPGLKNFYMTGHWVQPGGGVPVVAKCSRDLIQILCCKDKKEFKVN